MRARRTRSRANRVPTISTISRRRWKCGEGDVETRSEGEGGGGEVGSTPGVVGSITSWRVICESANDPQSRLRRTAGCGGICTEPATAQDPSEGRRYGPGLHFERHHGRQGEAERFPRQEQCRPGLLPGRLYRWLNEGNAGVPGWYR